MKIVNTPFTKTLVLEFKNQEEYIMFMEVLRKGKEHIESSGIKYHGDFDSGIREYISGLEGTLIYPTNTINIE